MRALLLAATALLTLASCNRPAPETPAPPAPPTEPWAYVGAAPAWIRVDLAAMRGDDRFQSLWDAMGEPSDNPLAHLIAEADTWAVAWPEPTFSERLNVAIGVPEDAVDTLVPSEGRVEYSAGRGAVISHPDREWVVSEPAAGLILTGTTEAVRSVVARPCSDCESPAGGVLTGSLRLTEGHRRMAGFAMSDSSYARLLEPIDRVEMRAVLGLGLDILIEVHAQPDANMVDVAALTEVFVQLAQRESAALGLPPAVMEDISVARGEQSVTVSWEIARVWLDAAAAMLVAEME